ncbi:hypothetical protein Poli38472_005607 [Pythium oligandrum]|uniref:Uncharacterized protein n=1 Tax=Pythium oligandrum TaxID=41045 RepID=A0A8K1CH74_PYTOL|nr:hypothetical protein Poli38472_005607 [Pythium oligandrum]|eukprot:TMW62989.1 hypothetical protein Poli38472_005607 [Pythium oligandrum]
MTITVGGDTMQTVWDGPVESWPPEHCRILCCIGKYAQQSTNVDTPESWIRQIALLVLLNEGIDSEILQLDYAPNLTWISYQRQTERRWLRISQEAKSVIDDLWEAQLVNGIKLSSIDYQPVTAYQISVKGLEVLERIPFKFVADTERFIYPPVPHERQLLRVQYDGHFFRVVSGAYSKISSITEVEDVSYVSSPYLPSCLRSTSGFRVEPTCNRTRAAESARGQNMMNKEAKESIVLSQVRGLVGEWMPFGANQIAALNERLGAMERCQGGLFSSEIDEHPIKTHLEVMPRLTQVRILDFDSINFINIEAEINLPEDDGVIQVEHFGMHLHVSGALLYGVRIEAIMDRSERDIPLDLFARLLVDVQQDSSEIIKNLLSRYQLSVLEMLFMNKPEQRNKYNLIMASGITPKVAASKYLDKGDRENELKQVLGEIYACYDITREDMLFLGRDGCLFVGPSAERYEALLTTFMGLNSREIFIRNFFVRTFVLDDTLNEMRKLISQYRKDPMNLHTVKETLNESARHIILLIECLQYLLESVEDLELIPMPADAAGAKLYKSLTLMERKNNIVLRCKDSIKLIERLRTQLDMLINKHETISRMQLTDVAQDIDVDIKHMVQLLFIRRQVLTNLAVIRVVFAGELSFDIIDRLSGSTFNVPVPQWYIDWIKTPVIDTPALFFGLNLLWFLLFWLGLRVWLHRESARYEASIVVRAQVDKRISVSALHAMIKKKKLMLHGCEFAQLNLERQLYIWVESEFPMPGSETQVELVVDERQRLLRSIRLQVFTSVASSKPMQKEKRRSFTGRSLRRMSTTASSSGLAENSTLDEFTKVLRSEGVYMETKAPLVRMGTLKLLDITKKTPVDRNLRTKRRNLSDAGLTKIRV